MVSYSETSILLIQAKQLGVYIGGGDVLVIELKLVLVMALLAKIQ